MIRVLIAGVLGAAVAFGWGFVSWMILPWQMDVRGQLPNEKQTLAHLAEYVSESGAYLFPYPVPADADKAARTDYEGRREAGPVGLLFIQHGGVQTSFAMTYLRGALIYLAAGLLAAVMLVQAAPAMPSYFQRVFFVMLLGLFAAIAVYMPQWNWLFRSVHYTVINLADLLVTWLLGGLIIGALVQSKKAKPAVPAE